MKQKIKRLEKPEEKKQFYYSQLNLKSVPIINCAGKTGVGMSASTLNLATNLNKSLSNNFVCKECGNFSKTGLIAGRCKDCNKKKMSEIIRQENTIHRRLAKALR